MIIGITGQIGSGKSTAARILKKLRAAVIDADKIGREVVESNPELIRKFARAFGRDSVTTNGKLKRSKVAEIAFSSKANKRKLDRLVHPFLLTNLRKQIKKLSKTHSLIVIDAALLLDWNLDRIVDQVLVVHTSLEKRLRRLRGRGIKRVDAIARQKLQLPLKEYMKRADKVIMNNSSQKEFEKKVKLWVEQLLN